MVTSTNLDKMGESAQTMVRTSQESAQIVTEYFVRAQELNTNLAQRAVETWIDGCRRQSELSQDVAQELFGRVEEQAGAFQKLFGQWGNAFTGYPFAGVMDAVFPLQRQGLRLVETVARGAEEITEAVTFPIAGYDEMNVGEISEQLDGLSVDELQTVRDYEKRNKDRDTLIEQIDRKMRAASS